MKESYDIELSSFILKFYFEIIADFNFKKGSYYKIFLKLALRLSPQNKSLQCLKNTHNAPALINCIKNR